MRYPFAGAYRTETQEKTVYSLYNIETEELDEQFDTLQEAQDAKNEAEYPCDYWIEVETIEEEVEVLDLDE